MRTFLKYAGYTVAGLLLLALVGVGTLYVLGGREIARTYEVEAAALTIPTDEASVARGRHLAGINGCVDCHGQNLGGRMFSEDAAFALVAASNLTPGRGGVGATYTDADWDRAVRHGVRPNGTSLFIMPAKGFHYLADEDMADLVAYLKRLPPVDNELPERAFGPVGRILAGGPLDLALEVDPTPTRATAPPAGPTAEYGAYLTQICGYCHGADLRGKQPDNPDAPFAPDLGAAGQWPFEVFEQVVRTGQLPGGRRMDPEHMPWTMTARMTDDELRAIHIRLAALGGARAPGETTTASR
jgi:mono/diheme cytochrome c family protein